MCVGSQQRERGFTLVELLIVVIILGILSAIVVPQFNVSTRDAKEAALDANLSVLRTAIAMYQAQHSNYPGATTAVPGAGVTCSSPGVASTGTAGTAQAVIDQLTLATDSNGYACSIGDAVRFRYGPYIRKGLPNEPISGKGSLASELTVTTSGAAVNPSSTTGGWAYDTRSGQLVTNSNATDSRGKPYSSH
jgi:prepilin-type N-terminal cleavage/methylation domain-containing protein